MKEPKLDDGEWESFYDGDLSQFQVVDGARVVATGIESPHESELMARSKSLAAMVHRHMELLRKMPNWEFIITDSKVKMIEEMKGELLKAGYTE